MFGDFRGFGAVNSNGIYAPFNSVGFSGGSFVKLNAVAVSWGTAVVTTEGTIGLNNGTSFSSPVLAGMAACLSQANPQDGALMIKKAIETLS